jgi:RNA polymerase sigma-70 factor (ECF subfamily)
MLGSLTDADDAIQEAWLRLSSPHGRHIASLAGWLTTVVARICLDMLRARSVRREQELIPETAEKIADHGAASNPEEEALLAEAVGIGLMVVLERLSPRERIAFVLHDIFGVAFEEVAAVLGATSGATRQLASRARRRVRSSSDRESQRAAEHHEIVAAFFAASHAGNFDALLSLLDPDVSFKVDRSVLPSGGPNIFEGAETVARMARTGAAKGGPAQVMLIDGKDGIAVAPNGRLRLVITFEIAKGKIHKIELVADPARLGKIELALPCEVDAIQQN